MNTLFNFVFTVWIICIIIETTYISNMQLRKQIDRIDHQVMYMEYRRTNILPDEVQSINEVQLISPLECYVAGGDKTMVIKSIPNGYIIKEKKLSDGRPTTGKVILSENGDQYLHCK